MEGFLKDLLIEKSVKGKGNFTYYTDGTFHFDSILLKGKQTTISGALSFNLEGDILKNHLKATLDIPSSAKYLLSSTPLELSLVLSKNLSHPQFNLHLTANHGSFSSFNFSNLSLILNGQWDKQLELKLTGESLINTLPLKFMSSLTSDLRHLSFTDTLLKIHNNQVELEGSFQDNLLQSTLNLKCEQLSLLEPLFKHPISGSIQGKALWKLAEDNADWKVNLHGENIFIGPIRCKQFKADVYTKSPSLLSSLKGSLTAHKVSYFPFLLDQVSMERIDNDFQIYIENAYPNFPLKYVAKGYIDLNKQQLKLEKMHGQLNNVPFTLSNTAELALEPLKIKLALSLMNDSSIKINLQSNEDKIHLKTACSNLPLALFNFPTFIYSIQKGTLNGSLDLHYPLDKEIMQGSADLNAQRVQFPSFPLDFFDLIFHTELSPYSIKVQSSLSSSKGFTSHQKLELPSYLSLASPYIHIDKKAPIKAFSSSKGHIPQLFNQLFLSGLTFWGTLDHSFDINGTVLKPRCLGAGKLNLQIESTLSGTKIDPLIFQFKGDGSSLNFSSPALNGKIDLDYGQGFPINIASNFHRITLANLRYFLAKGDIQTSIKGSLRKLLIKSSLQVKKANFTIPDQLSNAEIPFDISFTDSLGPAEKSISIQEKSPWFTLGSSSFDVLV